MRGWVCGVFTFEGQIVFSDVGLGGDLMGVDAVSESKLFYSRGIFLSEKVRDGKIVVCGLQERLDNLARTHAANYLESKHIPRLLRDIAFAKFLEKSRIVLWITQHRHTSMVLGSGTKEGDAADIDLLDSLFNLDKWLCNGFLEGVEVADDIVNFQDPKGIQILLIRVNVSGQNS
jgi:hypothetical protein